MGNSRKRRRMLPEEKEALNRELLPVYEQVAVYKEAFDLLVFVYRMTPGMRRDYRFTLGEEMKLTLQDMMEHIYEANKTRPKSDLIYAALSSSYRAKVLYRMMDELSLLRDWQCVEYIRRLASISKQLTAWYNYEKRKEQQKEKTTAPTGGA